MLESQRVGLDVQTQDSVCNAELPLRNSAISHLGAKFFNNRKIMCTQGPAVTSDRAAHLSWAPPVPAGTVGPAQPGTPVTRLLLDSTRLGVEGVQGVMTVTHKDGESDEQSWGRGRSGGAETAPAREPVSAGVKLAGAGREPRRCILLVPVPRGCAHAVHVAMGCATGQASRRSKFPFPRS